MFSFDAMACLAFGAITAVAIRAAKDSFISHDEDIETRNVGLKEFPILFGGFLIVRPL